jgi:hypothetical protein
LPHTAVDARPIRPGCRLPPSRLIRLGFDPGRIDGVQGERTLAALKDAAANLDDPASWLGVQLQSRFLQEYA